MPLQNYDLPNAPYLRQARLLDPLLLVLLLVDEDNIYLSAIKYSKKGKKYYLVFMVEELEVGTLFSSGPLLVE